MSEIKWKDVAHYYLGCEIVWGEHEPENIPNHTYTLKGVTHDGRGELFLPSRKGYVTPKLEQCKPILRPLSDIQKDEEGYQGLKLMHTTDREEQMKREALRTNFLLSKHFDLFNLIPSGQAISSPALKGEKE